MFSPFSTSQKTLSAPLPPLTCTEFTASDETDAHLHVSDVAKLTNSYILIEAIVINIYLLALRRKIRPWHN
jgi:hypothetical protein